jgi:hypothetical protein
MSCPVAGSTTLAAIVEVALMAATMHLLDLADAVGGVQPSETALVATRDLLVAVPDPWAAIEILAGRADPTGYAGDPVTVVHHSQQTGSCRWNKVSLANVVPARRDVAPNFRQFAEDS